jgi:hypothetical protein
MRPTDKELAQLLYRGADETIMAESNGRREVAKAMIQAADALNQPAEPAPVWDRENAEPGSYHDYAHYLPDTNNIGGRIRITINDEDGSAWFLFLGTDEQGDEWCEGFIEITKPAMAAQMVGHPTAALRAAGVEGC